MKNVSLPPVVTIKQACRWLNNETGRCWTLPLLLKHGVTPWFWLDHQPHFPEAVFNGRIEGFLAPLCFAGDLQRLSSDCQDVMVTMTRNPERMLFRLSPGIQFSVDELRFLDGDLQRLAEKFCATENLDSLQVRPAEDGDQVTLERLALEIAESQAEKHAGQWAERDGDDAVGKTIATTLNIISTAAIGFPGIRQHLLKMLKRGKISVRSTLNDMPPHKNSDISANLGNWYVSQEDAAKVRGYLLPGKRETHANNSTDHSGTTEKAAPDAGVGRPDALAPTTAQEQKANATQSTRRIPEQRFQEQEILRVISTLGHTPDSLPKWTPGKSGVKADVRRELKFSAAVFDKAWQRLRDEGRVRETG